MTKVRMTAVAADGLRRAGRGGTAPPSPGLWSYRVRCAFLELDDQLGKTISKEG